MILAQTLGPLPPILETQIEFLGLGFGLAQPSLLQPSGEGKRQMEALSLPISAFLFLSFHHSDKCIF